jgi:hypothetical protein
MRRLFDREAANLVEPILPLPESGQQARKRVHHGTLVLRELPAALRHEQQAVREDLSDHLARSAP